MTFSVRTQVLLAPALAILVSLGLGAFASFGFTSLTNTLNNTAKSRLPAYRIAAEVDSRLQEMNALVLQSLGYEAMGYAAEEIADVDKRLVLVGQDLTSLLETAQHEVSVQDQEAFRLMAADYERYLKATRETIDMKSTGAAVAAGFLSTSQKIYEALLKRVDEFKQAEFLEINQEVEHADALSKHSQQAIIGGTLFLAVLGTAVSLWTARHITRRLRHLQGATSRLAQGDLSTRIELPGRDEVSSLCKALEQTRGSFVGAVTNVLTAAESVRLATNEIATGNLDLSQRTETQASSLEQTAASMENISQLVNANTASVAGAAHAAVVSSELAAKSKTSSTAMLENMRQIHAKSKAISEITSLIDSISFRTNLLALNAAVEAAKAGDQGRGFTVVATEVRALANQSSVAAKEIRELITTSTELIESGVGQANTSSSATRDVAQRLQEVQSMLKEVNLATKSQAAGIAEISVALGQIESTTQQNAALVEQAAAASQNLTSQAQRLVESVRFFRLPQTLTLEHLS